VRFGYVYQAHRDEPISSNSSPLERSGGDFFVLYNLFYVNPERPYSVEYGLLRF